MKALAIGFSIALLAGSAALAAPITYIATLNGPSEAPPNGSPGIGNAVVTIDTVLNTLTVNVVFSGLTTGDTAAHIHCCTTTPFTGAAGVATTTPTFTGFPSGVTSGTYVNTFNLTLASSFNPSFVTAQGSVAAAEAALAAGLAVGDAYLNIHTTMFPGGEIRGFLIPTPEPATLLFTGAALLGLGIRRRLHH